MKSVCDLIQAHGCNINKIRLISPYTLPLSRQRVDQKINVIFVNKINSNRINSATKFLCVKTSSGKVVAESFPSNGVYMLAVNVTVGANI